MARTTITTNPGSGPAIDAVTFGGVIIPATIMRGMDADSTTPRDLLVDGTGALRVRPTGTFAYAAGTATATVSIPNGARVQRVSVVAGSSANGTVVILGGATITILAGSSFDEQIPGDAVAGAGATVVIGGTVQAYYVAWLV